MESTAAGVVGEPELLEPRPESQQIATEHASLTRLLSIFAITGTGTLAATLFSMITTKTIALQAGPAGVGVFAQLRQAQQWLTVFATANGQTSLVRGVASRNGRYGNQFTTAVALMFLLGSVIASVLLLLSAPAVTTLLFKKQAASLLLAMKSVAGLIFLAAGASFVQGLINGKRATNVLIRIQVSSAAVTALLTCPLLLLSKHPISYVLILAVGFLVTIVQGAFWIRRLDWLKEFRFRMLVPRLADLTSHYSFALSTLLVGLIGSGTVLLIRSAYVGAGGVASGGLFDAAWTISMSYVTLLLSSFGLYYFPTLSGTAGAQRIASLRWTPPVRQTVKTLFTVR